MVNKILKIVILICAIIGVGCGVYITIQRQIPNYEKKEIELSILSMMQTKSAEATAVYTYGKALNVEGKISNISEDNFESAKLYITDGLDYEAYYDLNYSFDGNTLNFSSKIINSEIIIDDLENTEYFIFLRLKLNNSVDPRYYSFSNSTEYEDIEYYTVTEDGSNRKAIISFDTESYEDKDYNLLKLSIEDSVLPDDVYDIVIDAGHGGTDVGENKGSITEAGIALEYAKSLKESFEELGYKVKLTRDDDNTSSYTSTNMYDEDGRISIACKTKAKLMISFHVNNDQTGTLSGFEIYSPCKSDLTLAKAMASKINEYSTISYSNNSTFQESEGVYVKNFTEALITSYASTAKKNGYEPYNITTETPFLYTIREVGGLATNAFVDGRNTAYSNNAYYKSNQGIECYQIELGYIKNDLSIIQNEKDYYIQAIKEAIQENY